MHIEQKRCNIRKLTWSEPKLVIRICPAWQKETAQRDPGIEVLR
jgi:hypothetical protein